MYCVIITMKTRQQTSVVDLLLNARAFRRIAESAVHDATAERALDRFNMMARMAF